MIPSTSFINAVVDIAVVAVIFSILSALVYGIYTAVKEDREETKWKKKYPKGKLILRMSIQQEYSKPTSCTVTADAPAGEHEWDELYAKAKEYMLNHVVKVHLQEGKRK